MMVDVATMRNTIILSLSQEIAKSSLVLLMICYTRVIWLLFENICIQVLTIFNEDNGRMVGACASNGALYRCSNSGTRYR